MGTIDHRTTTVSCLLSQDTQRAIRDSFPKSSHVFSIANTIISHTICTDVVHVATCQACCPCSCNNYASSKCTIITCILQMCTYVRMRRSVVMMSWQAGFNDPVAVISTSCLACHLILHSSSLWVRSRHVRSL